MTDKEARFELPEGWVWAAIEDVVQDAQIGLVRSRLQQNNEGKGFAYLKMNNVTTDGDVLLDNLVYVEAPPEEADRYSIRRGDILFNTRNSKELVGKTGLVRDNVSGMLYNNNLMRIRLASDVPPAFMVYQMCSPSYRERMERVKRATTNIAAVYAKDLMPLRIALAPLSEQRRIVEKIEELFSDLDVGVAALRQVRKQLQRYRQAVLKAAVEGKLTEAWRQQQGHEIEPAGVLLERILAERRRTWEAEQLAKYEAKGKTPPNNWQQRYKEPAAPDTADLPDMPDGWVWATVEQAAWESRYGTSTKCDYEFDGPPVLRIPNVFNGELNLGDLKYARGDTDLSNIDPLAPGDLLVIRTNGSKNLIGRAALVREQFEKPHFFASYLIRFRIIPVRPLPSWINVVWASPQTRTWLIREAATSAGQYNISQTTLWTLAVPVPPLEEQQAIIGEVDRLLSITDEAEKSVEHELKRAYRLRQSILKRAFEGKLVPQDPSDEPASVLLERIREEKKRPKAQTSVRKKHSTPPKASTQLTLDL